jgi:hypothetical protein
MLLLISLSVVEFIIQSIAILSFLTYLSHKALAILFTLSSNSFQVI